MRTAARASALATAALLGMALAGPAASAATTLTPRNNVVRLMNKSTGWCLYYDGNTVKTATCGNSYTDQRWNVEPLGGGIYQLRNLDYGTCLSGSPYSEGQKLTAIRCGGAGTRWSPDYSPAPGATVKWSVSDGSNTRCMGSNSEHNTYTWTCTSSNRQQWQLMNA
ncbi:RICIN domain-containing protein [Kitasatospora sp. NPDC057542]|uniref:RICIN domain-containing protein n=1 Tax=Streptomycetaceae TaxID=2062 RepID=UPI001CCC407B|nr:RICIN domain-containing protein [Streptomyces sp. LS1784]